MFKTIYKSLSRKVKKSIFALFKPNIPVDIKKIRKILIIKLFAIGEMLMSTPLIHSIRKTFPEADIHILTGKYIAEILKDNPEIDRMISIDEDIVLKKMFLKLMRLILELRREKYDVVFSLHRPFVMCIFAYLTGAPVRVGFDRNDEGILYTNKVKSNIKGRHQIEEYLDLIRILGFEPENRRKLIFLKDEVFKKADELLKESGIDYSIDRIIGISPAGGNNLAAYKLGTDALVRRWPDENYAALAEMLIKRLNAKVIVVGGKAENISAQIIKKKAGESVYDMTGKTDILTASAIISRLSLLITNDAGPMHIASAVNTFVIALFGPTDPNVAGPYTENSMIIRKGIECSPCFNKDTFPPFNMDCKEWRCMKEISPDEVFARIEEFYSKKI